MASERLPPGMDLGDLRDHMAIDRDDRCNMTVAEAGERWERRSGLTRERYEAMERAVDFVRYYREMFDFVPENEWPVLANDADAIVDAIEQAIAREKCK